MLDAKLLSLLLESLRSLNISVNETELQKSLDSKSVPAVKAWIEEHLGPETLLTKEEILLYSTLQKSGEIEALISSRDLSVTRGVWDRDLEIAIEQLQKSTTAIKRQTEILRVQHEAVAILVKDNRQNWAAREAVENTQTRSWTTENNHIRVAVDELLQNLRYQIAELAGLCKSADVGLRKTASEILRMDDKILLGLQKVASGFDQRYVGEDDIAERVRDLCARLIKYTVESVRTHLGTVYLEILAGKEDLDEEAIASDNAEIDALTDELDSLYAEILPVAQMSVKQQYLEPVIRLMALHAAQGGDKSSRVIQYISKNLSEINDQLRDFTIDTEEYKNYRAATLLMTNAIKFELSDDRAPSPKTKQPGSPTRLRKHNKPISPIRPRNTRRRSSATSFDDEENPELQILRNLGISLPVDLRNESNIAVTLNEILMDRQVKFNGNSQSTQEALEASISSQLHDAQVTLRLLMGSVLSETEYKTVSLLDTEVQEAIVMLEKGVEELKGVIKAVDLDPLNEKNVRRDDLVERWA